MSKNFMIEEEKMDQYLKEIFDWGEGKGLAPEELTLVLHYILNAMKEQLGLSIRSVMKHEGTA